MSTTSNARRTSGFPDILTYRYNGKLVYVTAGTNYKQAVQFAKDVFADELAGVDSRRISLSISVSVRGEAQTVRIAPMAWDRVIPTLQRYEIVDVEVSPAVVISDDKDAPPQYYSDELDSKEAKDFLSRSAEHLVPLPPSRSPSHSPSRRSPSPNLAGRARNWLGKHLNDAHADV